MSQFACLCTCRTPTPGILMAVGALEAAGLLQQLAVVLGTAVPNAGVVAGAIGLVSALVDNVPLVAATMGMYDLARVPIDSQLWQMIALCAGACQAVW
jgi:Na+/H+ antiporter NhaD/arsenite permease-like protein